MSLQLIEIGIKYFRNCGWRTAKTFSLNNSTSLCFRIKRATFVELSWRRRSQSRRNEIYCREKLSWLTIANPLQSPVPSANAPREVQWHNQPELHFRAKTIKSLSRDSFRGDLSQESYINNLISSVRWWSRVLLETNCLNTPRREIIKIHLEGNPKWRRYSRGSN